jgi:hypothetical protein
MPVKKTVVGASTNRTTDLKMPSRIDGGRDQRYKYAQFTNNDGTRDMRTTLTSKKK